MEDADERTLDDAENAADAGATRTGLWNENVASTYRVQDGLSTISGAPVLQPQQPADSPAADSPVRLRRAAASERLSRR